MSQTLSANARTSQRSFSWARIITLPVLAVLTIAISLLSLSFGAFDLSVTDILRLLGQQLGLVESSDIPATQSYVLLQLRLPRVVLGLLVGATLASIGAALQALFRNPLADPGLIGVTNGAMLAAVIGIVSIHPILAAIHPVLGYAGQVVLAFGGSLAVTALIYRLSTLGGRTFVATMLLAGIALASLCAAITGILIYFSSESQLRDITFWTMGSLGSAQWPVVLSLLPVSALVLAILLRQAPALNLLLLGEREAAYSGVDVQRIKRMVIFVTALGVGACVSITGAIGFVGLIIPHLLRIVKGTDHRFLIPASALFGGALLVGTDTLARTVIAPAELPIGVLVALLGSPFFLWLLLKSRLRNALNM